MSEASARKGKVWIWCMTVLLMASLLAPHPAGAQFADVSPKDWFGPAASDLYKLGVLNGYPSGGNLYFKPSQQITRAEFLRLCLHLLVEGGMRDFLAGPAPQTPPFADVPVGEWFALDVAFAKEWGIVDSVPVNFYPSRPITRAEAAAMVAQTMDMRGKPVPFRGYVGFSDVNPPDENIRKLYQGGIVDGYSNGTFRPAGTLNRAEAAVLLERAYAVALVPPTIGLTIALYAPRTPPFDEELQPAGVDFTGIRLNSPKSKDNLLRVNIAGHPDVWNTGVRYFVRRDAQAINIWNDPEGTSSPLLVDKDEQEISEASLRAGLDVWVENATIGSADLILEARTAYDNSVVESKRASFETFRSMVIVLGGKGQDPATYKAADPLSCSTTVCGIFDLALALYRDGYDVRSLSESSVLGSEDPGTGAAFDMLEEAVTKRGLLRLAVIGYSHGGGSAYNLLTRFTQEHPGLSVPYAAYVDAVENSFSLDPGSERRAPCVAAYFDNFYQEDECFHHPLLFLNFRGRFLGASNDCTDSQPEINNVSVNDDRPSFFSCVDHYDIDELGKVHLTIKDHLRSRLPAR